MAKYYFITLLWKNKIDNQGPLQCFGLAKTLCKIKFWGSVHGEGCYSNSALNSEMLSNGF